MDADERDIRDLITTWMSASRAGNTAMVLSLMTDDVVFTTPGQPPFGKQAFAAMSQTMTGITVDAANEILEIQVSESMAFARVRLTVTVTPQNGVSVTRAGYALSIYRKETDGRWRLARDANMMQVVV